MIGLLAKMSVSDWLLQQAKGTTGILNRAKPLKVELTKIQLQLFSYWKYSGRIMMTLRQNVHIGICNGAAMEETIFGKAKALELEAERTRSWRRWNMKNCGTRFFTN